MQTLTFLPWPSILLATLISFAVQFIWYSPLVFGKAWLKLTTIDPQKSSPNKGMFSSLVALLLQATLLSALLIVFHNRGIGLEWLVAVLLVALTHILHMLSAAFYNQKPLPLWAIDAGSHVAAVFAAGLVLAWL